MSIVKINRDELRDKIYGCWLGKNIGGTLGMPYECCTDMQDVHGYKNASGEPVPNDDLDLQLIWLRAIQDRGPLGVNAKVLGEYWLNFIPPHWNEYGICKSNMRAGLIPPLSGECYNELWRDSNGAWIRSEIWACLAPGCPDIAIKYAYEDACVDHGGGEGTNAALFTSAVQSAAFVVSDRDELIKIGLSKIPPDCRVAKSINIVLDSYKNGLSWKEARKAVVDDSADLGWFQAPANVAFVIIGWMYGEGDFGKSVCTAVNCGDDTDCTGATLGATLGIILGRKAIPKEWTEPIGDRIVTLAIDKGSCADRVFPGTLDELTKQVMAEVEHSIHAHKGQVEIVDGKSDISHASELKLDENIAAREIWKKSPYALEYDFIHTKVIVDYLVVPEIRAGVPLPMKITLINRMPDSRHLELIWHLPEGWIASTGLRSHTYITHWPPKQEIDVEITAESVTEATTRGILEIVTPGRPTVGLVPLIFYNSR
ncbi:ADP-ribosylglycohydrolase family protein [bacterium]|nr:ADP-ribosylglycohydrolase family protein [bacterium]